MKSLCCSSWNISSSLLLALFTDLVSVGRRLSPGCLRKQWQRRMLPWKRMTSRRKSTFLSDWRNIEDWERAMTVSKWYLLMVKSRISAVWPRYSDTMLPVRASHKRSAPSKQQVDTTEEDSSHCRWTMPAWRNTEREFRYVSQLANHHNISYNLFPSWSKISTQATTTQLDLPGGTRGASWEICDLTAKPPYVMESQDKWESVVVMHGELTSCWHLCLRTCVERSYIARVPSRYATAMRGRLEGEEWRNKEENL